jgi:hypothetical protein
MMSNVLTTIPASTRSWKGVVQRPMVRSSHQGVILWYLVIFHANVIMDYYGLCGLLLRTVMYCINYYYGLYRLYGLLICSWIWFEINVVYICVFVHVLLWSYIHVIFV